MSASIEIYRDGYCYASYFRIPPTCIDQINQLVFRQQSEERITSIPRDNPDEKAYQLLQNLLQLTEEMVTNPL